MGNDPEAIPTAQCSETCQCSQYYQLCRFIVNPAPTALPACRSAPIKHTRREPANSAIILPRRGEQRQVIAKADSGYSTRLAGMGRSCAITVMQTERSPIKRLLMVVMHVMNVMIERVLLFARARGKIVVVVVAIGNHLNALWRHSVRRVGSSTFLNV